MQKVDWFLLMHLHMPKKKEPKTIIDLTTLTGQQSSMSCDMFASLISTNDNLKKNY